MVLVVWVPAGTVCKATYPVSVPCKITDLIGYDMVSFHSVVTGGISTTGVAMVTLQVNTESSGISQPQLDNTCVSSAGSSSSNLVLGILLISILNLPSCSVVLVHKSF